MKIIENYPIIKTESKGRSSGEKQMNRAKAIDRRRKKNVRW